MIKKISRYSLQQIFIESLEGCNSFQIINGLNPFHLTLNGKECYIYIKNLSPAYFSNPDIWRVQLPRREDFEVIKNSAISFCWDMTLKIKYTLLGTPSGQNSD